jgi:hypothetical protein
MGKTRKYLAEIGRRGGLKSRRTLAPEAARSMVAVREARRAFRRFHSECFASMPTDRQVTRDDVAWVAARLLHHGEDSARATGQRLMGLIAPVDASRPARDTTSAAEAARLAAVRRLRPSDRLRQALQLSESTRALSLMSLRRRHPERTDRQLVELLLGETLPGGSGQR